MKAIAETLERLAGHYILLVLLMFIGMVLTAQGWNKGEAIIDGSFGALLYSLRKVEKAEKEDK